MFLFRSFIAMAAFTFSLNVAPLCLAADETPTAAKPQTALPQANEPMDNPNEPKLPPLPQMVTSLGAAVLDGKLYVYGGHTGNSHSYSNKLQANELRQLDLQQPSAWETLATGPRLQGLALLGHQGALYRIGGFSALNAEGEKQDMHSTAVVARFDLANKQWSEMPSLPEPRSSHDAAILNGKIYVAGGWQLRGAEESVWHKTAYVFDLAAANPTWERLTEPPFQRRAISVAGCQGKIYVVGGMQPDGTTVTRVDVFDPANGGSWSQAPNLSGEALEGFGTSSFAANNRLYVSTMKGTLQRLSADGKQWETVRQLPTARFFHRMLATDPQHLLIVGGASMTTGKYSQLDVIKLD